jgi:soluble P-type ATPase
MLDVQFVPADRLGRLDNIPAQLGARAKRLEAGRPEARQKADVVRHMGAERVVAIGNGVNDADMLGEAALGIAIVGPEGLAARALAAADAVVPSISDALGLLWNQNGTSLRSGVSCRPRQFERAPNQPWARDVIWATLFGPTPSW